MLKHILATTALATLLTTGVYGQTTDSATEATPDPTAPVVEGEGAMTGESVAPPEIVEDDTMAPADDPALAEDAPLAPADDPALAQDAPLDGAEDPTLADDAPLTDDPTLAEDAPLVDPVAPEADPMFAEDEYAPVDVSQMSAEQLIGVDITTFDGEKVASIEDMIVSDDGEVENIVAQFGGFLGFGTNKVLLTMDEIEVLQDPNETLIVRTSLTPESIEQRPAFEEDS
jgi:hypothetical protein